MTIRWRRVLFFVLGIALSLVFMYASLRQVDLGDVRAEIVAVPLIALIIEPFIRLGAMLVMAIRSRLVFQSLHAFSLRQLFESVWLAYALNNVIPFRAGEVARIGYLSRHGQLPASTCLAAIGIERLLDLLALLLIVAATLPFMGSRLPLGASFYVFTAVLVIALGSAFVVSRRPQLFRRMCRGIAGMFGARARDFVDRKSATFAEGLSALGSASRVFGVMLATLISWALALAIVQVWIWALSLDVPWYGPIVVLAFLSFGLAIPSTPGHVGTFHFFASSAVIYLGVSETEALSFAVVFHAMAVVPLTLLCLPVLIREYLRLRRANRLPDADAATAMETDTATRRL